MKITKTGKTIKTMKPKTRYENLVHAQAESEKARLLNTVGELANMITVLGFNPTFEAQVKELLDWAANQLRK
jgi:hypothetical protein